MIPTEKQMHIGVRRGETGRYCLLPGDPGRCEAIAAHFDAPALVARQREFTTYTGTLLGERVSVCSTGIGAPSAAIAVEELFACGVDTFIRVGTCGGIQERVIGGDTVIATGAIRQDGTSAQYVPVEYPAVADLDVTLALRDAARQSGQPFHVGVVQSKDSFYGQHMPQRMPARAELEAKWEAWKRAGALASEMESGAVLIVAGVLGARAGAAFHVIWNQEREAAGLPNPICHDTGRVIELAVCALKRLIEHDRA